MLLQGEQQLQVWQHQLLPRAVATFLLATALWRFPTICRPQ
jgi:hypothetical protein